MMYKKTIKYLSLFFLIVFGFSSLQAQELNCDVVVNADQIQGSNREVFESMQKAIYEFMNTRKWTQDKFQNNERIECSLLITINKMPSEGQFEATIQVQSRRPIYNTSYNSTMIRHVDKDFTFKYAQYQPLEYSDNSYIGDLTSVLAFYAYYIIAIDYDSFSLNGGTPYYQKAQKVVTNAQASPNKGWHSFEGTENRYWLVEDMLNGDYKPLRACIYQYHRMGFDVMAKDKTKGTTAVLEALKKLKPVYDQNPLNFPMKVFFDAKSQEIINLFSGATPAQKTAAVQLLKHINPANSSGYDSILKGN